jgi:ribosomal protein L24
MKKANLCTIKGCRKDKEHGRDICGMHHTRQVRKNNPIRASFVALKSNAKRRGHSFSLTIEEFTQFCYETNYIAGKGRSKKSFSIDRIDPAKGYHLDNLQMLTVSENSKKSNRLVYDLRTHTATVVKSQPIDTTNHIF